MNKVFKIIKNRGGNNGQVMLLTVLIMFGVILSATTVGGYLMLNQLRQAGNAGNSIKALAAADAGIECEVFNLFNDPGPDVDCDGLFGDDENVSVNTEVDTSIPGSTVIRSTGGAAKTFRAFELTVTTATSTP